MNAQDWVARLQQARSKQLPNEVPLHKTLLAYQRAGVRWILQGLIEAGGCILADEMGLGTPFAPRLFFSLSAAISTGKTIQTISCMQKFVDDDPSSKILVVAPTSIVPEWASQLSQWAPQLSKIMVSGHLLCCCPPPFTYHLAQLTGDAAERDALKTSIDASRQSVFGASAEAAFSVLVLSYETLLRESSFLHSFKWRAVVFDEAHRLKNPQSKTYQCVQESLSYDKAILLTGTPVQNNLVELYSLLSLMEPAVFQPGPEHAATFVQHLESANEGLSALISASILRRTVTSTALQLPPLRQVVVPCPLTPLQRKMYLSALHHNMRHVIAASGEGASAESAAAAAASLKLHNVVSVLQTVCNHPYLIAGVEPEPYEEGEHVVFASSKLDVLDQLLKRLVPAGHRVLIFSHFTRTLDVLQDFCNMREYSFERLDGSVRGDERWDAVKRFQSAAAGQGEGGPSVFLLSTRAGGQGLTLTKADTVVLFDSGMNPQWDEQAIKRAHRMGQTRPVLVVRLATKGTAEEVILARGMRKLQLSKQVMEHTSAAGAALVPGEDDDTEEASHGDLLTAIRCGASALLAEDDAEEATGDAAALPLHVRRPEASSCALSDSEVTAILDARTVVPRRPAQTAQATGPSLADSEDPVALVQDTSHVYVLDGVDYSAKVASSSAQDTAAWDAWVAKQAQRKRTPAAAAARSGVPDMSPAEWAAAEKAAAKAKQLKAFSRWQTQQEQWRKSGYSTCAVRKPRPTDPAAVDSDGQADSRQPAATELMQQLGWSEQSDFRFVHGNVAKPAMPPPQQMLQVAQDASHPTASAAASGDSHDSPHAAGVELHQVIVHCVDSSGAWAKGGVFSAIDGVDTQGIVAKAYSDAKANKDLHLGDVHLVSMQQGGSGAPQLHCALLVCLQRPSASKRSRDGRGAGRIALNTSALGQALGRLSGHILDTCSSSKLPQHAFTVHCPRIGAGIRGTSYYAVERYLRNHLLGSGLHTTVYYYRRPGRALGAADSAALRAAMAAGAQHMQRLGGGAAASTHTNGETQGASTDESESAQSSDSGASSDGSSAMVSLHSDSEECSDGGSDADRLAAAASSRTSSAAQPRSKRARRAPRTTDPGDPVPCSPPGATPAGSAAEGGALPAGAQSEYTPEQVEWWLLEAVKEKAETEFPQFVDNIHYVWQRAQGDAEEQAAVRAAAANVQQGAAAAAQCGQAQRARVLSFFGKVMRKALLLGSQS